MSKYDFGYELVPGTTIEWAYQIIEHGATVLEVGPATGNLAYHLSTQKDCTVDIVELDESAGKLAARFARNSCLGFVEGNLENDGWYQKLTDNRYDYIVILDVLEHIRNAEEVMQKLGMLLKDAGTILLSMPNIAHNSVIMDLLRNRFKYTNVGLLDDTHVHFYTYDSVKELLNKNGLITVREQLIQKSVGQNEIAIDYGMTSRDVEAYIKTRNLGTAYQFLLSIQKGKKQPDIRLEYDDTYDNLYEFVCFDANKYSVLSNIKFNPSKNLSVRIEIPQGTTCVRIDPMDKNCILSNIQITAIIENGEEVEIVPKEFTGIMVDGKYVFFDDDPQIYVQLPDGASDIRFRCVYEYFDTKGLELLNPFRDIFRQSQYDVAELKNLVDRNNAEMSRLYNKIIGLENKVGEQINIIEQHVVRNSEQEAKISEQERQICEQHEHTISLTNQLEQSRLQCDNFETELKDIYSTVWGKIYYKLNKSKKA